MDEVRLGLVGAGPWGANIVRTIAELPGMLLTRLASRNPRSRDLVGRKCAISTDWRDVAGARDLDGVIIATPPDTHFAIASMALSHQIPVLIEKPLTMNLGQAEKLLHLAGSRAVHVQVDHTHLYHPAFRKLKSLLPQLGSLEVIRGRAGKRGQSRADTPVLWDWGPHDLAMSR